MTVAELSGVRNAEIHIEITEDTLKRHSLTLNQVSQAIRKASLDLPAGSIKTKGNEILLRAKGRRYLASEYNNIPIITSPDGKNLTLGQIAQLRDGFTDSDIFTRMQGKPAALIQVFRVADQNALTVAKQVKDYVEEKRLSLPDGIGTFRRSIRYSEKPHGYAGAQSRHRPLVVLVLWAFLEWRCLGSWHLVPGINHSASGSGPCLMLMYP